MWAPLFCIAMMVMYGLFAFVRHQAGLDNSDAILLLTVWNAALVIIASREAE